jgi:hypothetical protein
VAFFGSKTAVNAFLARLPPVSQSDTAVAVGVKVPESVGARGARALQGGGTTLVFAYSLNEVLYGGLLGDLWKSAKDLAPDYVKGLVRDQVTGWVWDQFTDLTFGSAAAALCVDQACRGRVKSRESSDLYGDCLAIVFKVLKLPPSEPEDAYVVQCRDRCREVLRSATYRENCLRSP